jgi:two-component sensor histidine kinase
MKDPRHTGRFLFWGITVLMLAAGAFYALGIRSHLQRTDDLFRNALDVSVHDIGARLENELNDHAQDLQQEASFIRQFDSLPASKLLERWPPLMNTHWAITSIHLADEDGGELVLQRNDSLWSVRSSDSLLWRLSTPSSAGRVDLTPDGLTYAWTYDTLNDPRETIWFSRALEDRSGEPIWSSTHDPDHAVEHHVSVLVRGRNVHQPYCILSFTIKVSTVLAELRGLPAQDGVRWFVLNNDGQDLVLGDGSDTPDALRDTAMQLWHTERYRGKFRGSVGKEGFHALVVPNSIQGETFQVGTVVLDEQILQRMRPERRALVLAGLFLLFMALLLLWSHIRRRREAKLLRQQEKRTRSRERELAKALGERDVLDREVHHRVKNNLQVVSSLLNLQAQRIPEGPTKDEFVRGKRRIDSMALVHHKLYGMQDLRSIKLKDLFQQLADSVAALHRPGSSTVSHTVDTANIVSDPDTAIELGIILCELLDNCHEHAFPFSTGGHIVVQVREVAGDQFRLTVSDNGKGTEEQRPMDTTKLGLEIVEALAGQLDGSFSMKSGNGATCEVLFRMMHPLG